MFLKNEKNKSEKFKNETNSLDFSGVESATDYTFHKLGGYLKSFGLNSPIDLDSILIRGIQYISIWSVHYLYRSVNKSLFDLKASKLKVKLIESIRL